DVGEAPQLESKRRRHPEAAAATAAIRPKQVGVLPDGGVNLAALRVHQIDAQEVVTREAERTRQVAIAAAERMARHADGRATAGRESEIMRRQRLVDAAE